MKAFNKRTARIKRHEVKDEAHKALVDLQSAPSYNELKELQGDNLGTESDLELFKAFQEIADSDFDVTEIRVNETNNSC